MPSASQFEAPQGNPLHEVQLRAITEGLAGNGVVDAGDLELTAGSGALELDAAAGTVFYIATEYNYAGESPALTLSGGDGSDDRWDTIAFDTATSDVVVHEGTPSSTPTAPDIEGAEILLGVVYIPAGATDVSDAQILNWRAMFSNEAEHVHYDDTTGVYGISSVEDALDELQEAAQATAYPFALADLDTPFALPSITDMDVDGTDLTDAATVLYESANGWFRNETIQALANLTGDEQFNAHPFISADIATDAIGSDEIDLSFTPTWTGSHTWDAEQVMAHLTTPSTPASGYDKAYFKSDHFLYSLAEDGRERRVGGDVKTASVTANYTTQYEDVIFADPSGTGGITITLATADARDGHGIMVIDTGQAAEANNITIETEGSETIDGGSSVTINDDSTQYLLESDGTDWFSAGGTAAIGINDAEFNTDESGSVADANAGVVYVTQVEDGRTFAVYQAGLILADGQAAPTNLDLVIASLDNAGAATKQTAIITGDGTVQADETGEPLASYENTTGGEETVAILVDNGNFNSGTGSSQDIFATAHGEVEV